MKLKIRNFVYQSKSKCSGEKIFTLKCEAVEEEYHEKNTSKLYSSTALE